MNKLRVFATVFVLGLAALAIWVASTGMRQDSTGGKTEETTYAYDYRATDVVVTQIGPDGSLQYELTAKEITQEPQDGQITAHELVMHRDPPGSMPGGPNRMTLTADRADLPEVGGTLFLKGNVRAEGKPEKWRTKLDVAASELSYNFQTSEIASDKPVDATWGSNSMNVKSLRFNIRTGNMKTGPITLNSANGSFAR